MTDVLTAALTGTLGPAAGCGARSRRKPAEPGSPPDRVRQVLVAVALWLAVLVGLTALARHAPAACHGTTAHLRQQLSVRA